MHVAGEHSVMPLSYRAEPMHNRLPHVMRRLAERTPREVPHGQVGVDRRAVTWRLGDELDEQFWTARTPEGDYLERVAGEEQHHSSWLFGDPVTPLLRAYAGDPCRIRLVHAGVKETHVFHLHVHQWRAIAADVPTDTRPGAQLLDSITIGPQAAETIDPLYGSGSRQHAVGDIIWHCHLYPHFHHGMWGLWRSFDKPVDGTLAYPDGTPCPPLVPLPGRPPEGSERPGAGFPWFVEGTYPMKSPPPPAISQETRGGRRLLLGLPAHSEAEWAAMAPGCRSGAAPGALFVDLDAKAAEWNAAAGLAPPRLVSYDVEVYSSKVTYNADGWHDPRGHAYRLLAASVSSRGADGEWVAEHSRTFEVRPGADPEPFYPRANKGDIVEIRFHNALGAFGADDFDHGQAPVECGLHVHLVKFDVLAADGSATGWNYLSGASCREAVGSDHLGVQRTVGLHRWVVDEEFGPVFFHDHLLANFRQKHGLFGALIAEPHGSQWHDPADQSEVAWSGAEAVVVPPAESGTGPFREACLAIGDFVPLLDGRGRPLNPPTTLSGADDPGAMAVNYRCAPLTHRGDDPSVWFANAARSTPSLAGVPGDPDTPVIETYPSEHLRLRLIQGSHEEQHSFAAHGLRWRRGRGDDAPVANQQSIGISEAFTLDIDPADASPYGPGDHLWSFTSLDDLWLGCWGYVRVLRPTPENLARFAPLPDLVSSPAEQFERLRSTRATPVRGRDDDGQPAPTREFVVTARRCEHLYAGTHLTDPWGLRYQVAEFDNDEYEAARRTGRWAPSTVHEGEGPLVLRAHPGEWVRVFVVNELFGRDTGDERLPRFGPEPSPARLPLENLDELGRPQARTVSPRISVHASLVRYDVVGNDGAWVGRNSDSTVASLPDPEEEAHVHEPAGGVAGRRGGEGDAGGDHDSHDQPNWTELWWYVDEALAPASHADGPGQTCVLYDMADIRNHRHHGLIGSLVALPGDVRPFRPGSTAAEPDGYDGVEAELRDATGCVVAREGTVVVQDGLRFFVNGHPNHPVPDSNPDDDPEDSGQKAISYRSAPIHAGRPPTGTDIEPLVTVDVGDTVWLRMACLGDKPRQHSLTVHGFDWQAAPWIPNGPRTGSFSGVTGGWARDVVLHAEHPGDHAIRSGCFTGGTEDGVWANLRVRD